MKTLDIDHNMVFSDSPKAKNYWNNLDSKLKRSYFIYKDVPLGEEKFQNIREVFVYCIEGLDYLSKAFDIKVDNKILENNGFKNQEVEILANSDFKKLICALKIMCKDNKLTL